MINENVIPYTPENFRQVIADSGLTQSEWAQLMGVADVTVRRWLMPVDKISHEPASRMRWLEVLAIAKSFKKDD